MGKNVIVSEDTIRDLLEAHASLSAWYYELWSALRAANASARAPDDAARAAFLESTAVSFPEVASVARSIRVPRLFVPPPPSLGGPPSSQGQIEDPPTAIEPAPARKRELAVSPRDEATASAEPHPPPAAHDVEAAPPPTQPAIAPPAMVIPSKVKYES